MSEEKTQQIMYQMQMLEAYLSELIQREGSLVSILKEAVASVESINALKETPDSKTLVPMGMGTFVKTKISSKDKIILNVGAGVAIEKSSEDAVNYLESRIKEIEVALRETSMKKQETATTLEQGKQEINKIIQSSTPPK